MKYRSTTARYKHILFSEASLSGLSPDGGLYIPNELIKLPQHFFQSIEQYSMQEIAFRVLYPYVEDEIVERDFQDIISDSFCFDIPLVEVKKDIYALELFHGPTLAFKDIGARFMSRVLSYFSKNRHDKISILVATSGDTGSAVASGFFKVPNIEVVLLYPSKKVSPLQEKQLTTYGANITALEVEGTFDDCQAMVKQAFLDASLQEKHTLTSANSINIARLLPQSFYYFVAYKAIKKKDVPVVFSVPSGNFGNMTGGIWAKAMGLPIHRFIAATNINDTIPVFLETGAYTPKPSKQTIASAMDVGKPNNFDRLNDYFEGSLGAFRSNMLPYRLEDSDIQNTIKKVFDDTSYVLDPHGAIAHQALEDNLEPNQQGIFLETAHPSKFFEEVEKCIDTKLEIHPNLQACMQKQKKSIKIEKGFESLKAFLMER